MARPGTPTVFHTGGPQPSRTSSFIDMATQAATGYVDHVARQKAEDEAVAQLVPYISKLDNKSRAALMSKLATENPKVMARVAEKIGAMPAPVDQMEEAARAATFAAAGYNPNPTISMERAAPPPPAPGPLGMLGGAPQINNPLGAVAPSAPYDPNDAKPPVPPGFEALPTDPFEKAHMMSMRDLLVSDKTSGANWTDMNLGRALPASDQPAALRVGLKVQADANNVNTQRNENVRSETTAATARRGQDIGLTEAGIRANVERERIGTKDSTLSQMKALQSRIDKNAAEIRRIQRDASVGKADPATVQMQVSSLNRDSIQAKADMNALRSTKKAAPAAKADTATVFVSKAEWNKLIAAGKTPAEIMAEGIRLK